MSDTIYGYLAVFGAIFFFGSLGLAIKSKRVVDAAVDPMVFQLYYSFAIFGSSWLVLSYVPFAFTFWGIISAALWVPASVLSIFAIKFLGLSISQGVWSGITIIVSFIWGSAYFKDDVKSIGLAVAALLILVGGIVGLSLSNIQPIANCQYKIPIIREFAFFLRKKNILLAAPSGSESGSVDDSKNSYEPVDSDDSRSSSDDDHHDDVSKANDWTENDDRPYLAVPSQVESVVSDGEGAIPKNSINGSPYDQESVINTPAAEENSLKLRFLGLLCAIALGGFNGSMMVPLRLAPKEVQGINFIISFGIGVVAVTPILFVGYCLALRTLPKFQPRVALIPGLIAGILWNAGNYCSIYATLYLGLTIGFPLTQVALLMAGLYGIFWFKEFESLTSIIFFFISAGVLLGGAAMLSLFG